MKANVEDFEDYSKRDKYFQMALNMLEKIKNIVINKYFEIKNVIFEVYINRYYSRDVILLIYNNELADLYEIKPLDIKYTTTQNETIDKEIRHLMDLCEDICVKHTIDRITEFVEKNGLTFTEKPHKVEGSNSLKVYAKARKNHLVYDFRGIIWKYYEDVTVLNYPNLIYNRFIVTKRSYYFSENVTVSVTDTKHKLYKTFTL